MIYVRQGRIWNKMLLNLFNSKAIVKERYSTWCGFSTEMKLYLYTK